MTAVRGALRAKGEGRPVSEILGNGDLFGEEASHQARDLILNKFGHLASRDAIAGNLRKYAEEAQKNFAGPNLFGDSVPPGDVLRAALKASAEKTPTTGSEPGLESAALKPPPRPTMDALAAARLRAATEATKARRLAYDSGPVGAVLRPGATASEYRIAPSSVPARLFPTGPGGADAVAAYRGAAGHAGPPNMNPLLDAAAASLHREAMTPEGMVDPAKFSRWQAAHQHSLRALPPEISARFSDAAKAAEAVGDAATARKNEIDSFQKSEAGRVAKLDANHDIVGHVGAIMRATDGVRRMRQLAQSVAHNPDAREGLRKAVIDYVLGRSIGVMESGTSDIGKLKLSDLVDTLHKNADVIQAAGFSPRELGSMQAVAKDLQRSQRTLQATRLPGGSNSPQDILKSIEAAGHGGKLSLLGKLAGAAFLGFEHGGLWGVAGGAAAGIGEHLIAARRAAGVAKANALVRDAMLNPELAADLLKAPVRPYAPIERSVAKTLMRSAMYPSVQHARKPPGKR